MQSIDPPRTPRAQPNPPDPNDSYPIGLIGVHVRVHYLRAGTILLALAVLAAACSAPARRETPPVLASPVSLTAHGDWNDVDAALEVALTRAQMAILSRSADGPDRITWQLLSVRDEPAQLTAARPPGRTQNPTDITLEARIGHFGDPQREEQFLKYVERRLEQLAGVDYAPLAQ